MLLDIIAIVSAIIGSTSGLITIADYWKLTRKPRRFLVAITILFAIVTTTIGYSLMERRHAEDLAKLKEQILKADAQSVSRAIMITGYEDAGDYLGYLSQIIGFYSRHSELYQNEYTTYNQQLSEWQDFLKRARESNKVLFSSHVADLRGGVHPV